MKRSIAVFDSGVGGLTVFQALSRLLPKENFVYLADNKRAPYGDLSPDTLLQHASEVVSFLKEAKVVVFGCHTLSSRCLQTVFPAPVIGMVQASVRSVRGKRVAILGTTRTIDSGVYQTLIRQKYPHVEIFPVACPLLAPLIEQGLDTEMVLRAYLGPLQVDSVLLACTHYPLVRKKIQKVLGEKVLLIDPSDQVAEDVKAYLQERKLLNDEKDPCHQFYVTKASEDFSRQVAVFLGKQVTPNFVEINSKSCVYTE